MNVTRRRGAERPSRCSPSKRPDRDTSLPSWSSYRLNLEGPGLARRHLSVRGCDAAITSKSIYRLPRAASVPKGFVYIPAGELLVRRRRRATAHAVPERGADSPTADRRLSDRPARDDVSRLDRIPERVARSRAKACHAPQVDRFDERIGQPDGRRGRLAADLPDVDTKIRRCDWRIASSTRTNRAARQDWMRFPVAGVSSVDARALLRLAAARQGRFRARGSAPSWNGSGPRVAPTIACSRTATS